MVKKIFNGFIFFNEIDLFLLRLRELSEVVDYFVLCESTLDFRGKAKPLYFAENKSLFQQYEDKIIHVVVADMPLADASRSEKLLSEHEPSIWRMEYFQRDAIRRGLGQANPDDVIVISDADEIPSKSAIQFLRENDGYFQLDMSMFQFYLNMRACDSGWGSVFAYSYYLADLIPDYNLLRRSSAKFFEAFHEPKHQVKKGGWHFTFVGGQDRVQQKLASYSHTDGWQRQMWDAHLLQKQMLELMHVGGGHVLNFCAIDNSFPDAVQFFMQEYIEAGLIKTAETRIAELEMLWSRTAEIGARNISLESKIKNQDRIISKMRRDLHKVSEIVSRLSVNLLESSSNFAAGWFSGIQTEPASVLEAHFPVKRLHENCSIAVHSRDDPSVKTDNNCGYWAVENIEPDLFYTVSCWVHLPDNFKGVVLISIGEWANQTHREANTKTNGGWRRIVSTAKSPKFVKVCNAVLRVSSETATKILSTCWQLEEGETATEYRPAEGYIA